MLPLSASPDLTILSRVEKFVRVVFPTALALLLCNMDRIVMSVAILPMSAEFGWAPGMQVHGAHGDLQHPASAE